MHMDICFKGFSGTTAPRILKFGTVLDAITCIVWDKISISNLMLIIPFICHFYLFSNISFLKIS